MYRLIVALLWLSPFFLIAFGVAAGQMVARIKCADTGEQTNLDHRYSWKSGCYIRTKAGQWIPADRFRATIED
jgi:hypothetical protein